MAWQHGFNTLIHNGDSESYIRGLYGVQQNCSKALVYKSPLMLPIQAKLLTITSKTAERNNQGFYIITLAVSSITDGSAP